MTLKAVKDLLVGTLVGVVSMLPGASGATIAVIFGIYERLISDIADIRRKLLHDLRFIIPVGIGILIGLFVCAIGLDSLMKMWEIPMMFFFAALILTQIPDVMELGNDENAVTKYNVLALIVGMVIMFVFLAIGLSGGGAENNVDNPIVWLLAGVVLAMSKLAPGISGSSILLAVGLFGPMMSAMKDFDMSVLIPGGIGLLVGALAFAKVIDHFLTNNRKSTYFVILGLTVGSVITVGIEACMGLDGTTMIVQSIIGIVLGLVLGVGLSKVSKRYAQETIDEKIVTE